MAKASAIVRRSIHAFSQHYQPLAATAALLAFPASAAILVSQALVSIFSPSILRSISLRLWLLLEAAGFPASSELFSFLNLKLSQSIFSYAFTLPFTLTFLIATRASVVQIVGGFARRKSSPQLSSVLCIYHRMLLSHLFNSSVLIAVNAMFFFVVLMVSSLVELLGASLTGTVAFALSSAAAIAYSVVLAYSVETCNLASIISADDCSSSASPAHMPLLKASMAIRGNAETTMSLALTTNLGMAAVEALFQYRVVNPHVLVGRDSRNPAMIIWEGFTIAYIHSMLLVLDALMGIMFLKDIRKELLQILLPNWFCCSPIGSSSAKEACRVELHCWNESS